MGKLLPDGKPDGSFNGTIGNLSQTSGAFGGPRGKCFVLAPWHVAQGILFQMRVDVDKAREQEKVTKINNAVVASARNSTSWSDAYNLIVLDADCCVGQNLKGGKEDPFCEIDCCHRVCPDAKYNGHAGRGFFVDYNKELKRTIWQEDNNAKQFVAYYKISKRSFSTRTSSLLSMEFGKAQNNCLIFSTTASSGIRRT